MTQQPVYTVQEAARLLAMSSDDLFDLLRENKLLYRDGITGCTLPHLKYMRDGLFAQRTYWGGSREKARTLITQAGLDYIRTHLTTIPREEYIERKAL